MSRTEPGWPMTSWSSPRQYAEFPNSHVPSLIGGEIPVSSSYGLASSYRQPQISGSASRYQPLFPMQPGTPAGQPWNISDTFGVPVGRPQAAQQSSAAKDTLSARFAKSSSTRQKSSDWKEYMTANRKRYYYNWKMKKSTWEKPSDLMTPIERADTMTDWKEYTSSKGKTFYHNKVTNQSTWIIPPELKLAREQVENAATTPSVEEAAVVPPISVASTVSSVRTSSPTIAPSGIASAYHVPSGGIPSISSAGQTIENAGHGVAAQDLKLQEFLSLSNMMEALEVNEGKAKRAKEEASKAGQDILSKVEELRKMLKREKEANDMHAGRVNAEKSILSSESQELSSRLLSLSEEINKSPLIIREIHRSLEARLAVAKEELASAEQEKLDKEACARRLLKEEQLLLENMAEQSRRLKQEEEDNAKCREFLKEGWCIVDELQGEVVVIQENVQALALDEKFGGKYPTLTK